LTVTTSETRKRKTRKIHRKGQEEKQNPIRKRASENMRNDRNLALVQPVVHCGTLGVRNTSSFMPDL
jgi:hypothetical protein